MAVTITACKGCAAETETDDSVCPECSAFASKLLGPRIAELEEALRPFADFADHVADDENVSAFGHLFGSEFHQARRMLRSGS